MFDIIKSIIDHIFDPAGGSEQQYIYYICATVLPLCIILAWDAICCIIRSFTRWK